MEEFINVILTVVQFSVRDRCSEVAFSYFVHWRPFGCGMMHLALAHIWVIT